MKPIDTGAAYFMITIAVIIDLVGLIPFVGTILDIFASMLFGIWFSHYGMSVMTRRTFSFLMTTLAEFIPGIGMVPFWKIFVVTTIRKQRAESAV